MTTELYGFLSLSGFTWAAWMSLAADKTTVGRKSEMEASVKHHAHLAAAATTSQAKPYRPGMGFLMKNDWEQALKQETDQEYYKTLMEFIDQEYAAETVYPPREKIFAALELTGYRDTKAVILGQDPYHGANQAHGLSFSVADEKAKFPPSLRNMFKELESDLGHTRTCRNLTDWAEQGVLLLNTVLTVRAGQAGSHRGKGWERFTDAIIRILNDRDDPVIFVLWGGDAKKKLPLLTNERHKVICAAHPSPLSAYNGFFGSKPYSAVSGLLREMGKAEIDWYSE